MSQVKDRFIRQIERSYAQLIEAIDQLSPALFDRQPEDGSWSARDILAHIAQWEMVLLRFHLQGQDFSKAVGIKDVRYRETPFDVINQHLYLMQRQRTPTEIRDFARQTHSKLMKELAALPAEVLHEPAAPLAAQGYSAQPLIGYIEAITIEHYDDHLASLQQLAQLE